MIKMTQAELEKLMNSTIASYEKNKERSKGSAGNSDEVNILQTATHRGTLTQNSETTICSRLCPPINEVRKDENFP